MGGKNPAVRLVAIVLLVSATSPVFAGGLPICVSATQDPDTTVTPRDVGTVVTLMLETANAVSAEIDGRGMGGGAPTWTATHTVVADTMVTAVIENATGDQANCEWSIFVNCDDPTIDTVADPGDAGITIAGSDGCTYTIRVIDEAMTVTDYDQEVFGSTGTLNIVVPPNATIQVGQQGLPSVTDAFITTPVELLEFEID